jgi:hypothetical protein
MKKFYLFFLLAIISLTAYTKSQYVDASAAAGGDGTSWTTAFDSLHKALAVAGSGDTIFMAEGVYKPPTDTDRTAYFRMVSGAVLMGGYPAGGGVRNITDHRTILSGDIGVQGDPADNTYHVIMCYQTNPATVLDGLYITGGYADGSGDDGLGGGIYARTNTSRYYGVMIIRCHIYDNYAGGGGGVAINQKGEVYYSVIENNRAASYGGGLYIKDDGRAYNTVIRNNYAEKGGGGVSIGGFNYASGLINCIISNNETAGEGSGINQGKCRVTNCNIVNNKGGYAVYQGTYGILSNTIVWGNTPLQFRKGHDGSVTACAIADTSLHDPQIIVLDSMNSGLNDTAHYVRFFYPADSVGNVSTPEGMTHLRQAWWYILPGSACINRGDKAQYPDVAPENDYFGYPRVIMDTIDIGIAEARLDLSTDSAVVTDNKVILHGNVLFSIDLDLTRRGFDWGSTPGELNHHIENIATGWYAYSDTVMPAPAPGVYYYRTWGMLATTVYPGPVKRFVICSTDTTEEFREACFGTEVLFPDGSMIDSITEGTSHLSVLTSVSGCDSVVRTVVEVLPVYNDTMTVMLCSGENYTFPDGTLLENIDNDTSHTSILATGEGCDSLVTVDLTVHHVDTAVTVESITLTAVVENATYQWVDCDNDYAVINDAIYRSFTPAENGNYAVIVTDDHCSDTSSCHAVTTVGIVGPRAGSGFEIFPVPAHNRVTLRLSDGLFSGTVEVMNVVGMHIRSITVQEAASAEIPLDGMRPGVYFLKITANGHTTVLRFMKK